MSSPTLELYDATKRRSLAAMLGVRMLWRRVDPAGDWLSQWQRSLPLAVGVVSAAQLGAATDGARTVPLELAASGYPEKPLGVVTPRGFVGWMQHDRDLGSTDLASALLSPVGYARSLKLGTEAERLLAAGRMLEGLAQVAVADAARMAAGAQGAATERTVAAWYEPPPYCQRCAVLIGKRVRWGTQFARHPRCDGQVQHLSERDDRRLPGVSVEQITDLSKAQQRAVEDGADLTQVVNARRGLYTATIGGRSISATTANAKGLPMRLTPRGIYAIAGDDRERAVELLAANRYIR